MSEKDRIDRMIKEFSLVMSKKEMYNNYKWFSLASGIKDNEKTKDILRESLQDLRGNI